MQNDLFKFVFNKDYEKIRACLSSDPALANEGIALNDNCNSKKGHPLHRICDAVFAKKITDDEAIEIAKIFLAYGADIDGYKSLGDENTPLIAAASLHAENLGIFYVEQGADIFYVSKLHGATALHWAAFCGRDKLVSKLIEKGANLNQHDVSFDGTPVDWAVHELTSNPDSDNIHHQPLCIKLLLKAGTDINQLHENTIRYLQELSSTDEGLKSYLVK
jgi:ankyrin repeat protein